MPRFTFLRRRTVIFLIAGLPCTLGASSLMSQPVNDDDPYLWLEEVDGERALEWVEEQNAVSVAEITAHPDFESLRQRLLAISNSDERIPGVSQHGDFLYNFWRDAEHERGLWRRTTMSEYRKSDPAWEAVLDLDAVAAEEGENWVWKGYSVLYPDNDRALLHLSRGGGDAVVIREFDLNRKTFVEDGFVIPEAKSDVAWRDRDSLYVGSDFGPGSLTDSGYPRTARLWQRGQALAEAPVVYEGLQEDVAAGVGVSLTGDYRYEFAYRSPTFFTTRYAILSDGVWKAVDKPDDVDLSLFRNFLLLRPKLDWTTGGRTYPAGTLLATDFEAYMQGSRDFDVLFEPGERTSLESFTAVRNHVILNVMDNVVSRLYALTPADTGWQSQALATPDFAEVAVAALDSHESDAYLMTVSNYLTPTQLQLATVGESGVEVLKSLPAFFDTDGLEITQHEAVSKDGTRVPYFQVSREGMALDGSNPTQLYGYGGFEVSYLPAYSATLGAAWLEKGGVFVLANIRGGGEFGPDWHNAGRKENRQRVFDDFIAVAENLITRGVTSPEHLGIRGGSNGGLLMGVMLTQRPDLFGAILCQVPLLDMKRYNKLLAGASWMDEYGNPDIPEEWAWISQYSPYQNVKADADYPRVLFTTSTRDDRVHPGHARKMAARMLEYGHDILLYENTEGGHGGAANNEQSAFMNALGYTFLWQELQ